MAEDYSVNNFPLPNEFRCRLLPNVICREKRLKIGQQVTVINPPSSYFLPPGLEHGTKAVVREWSYGTATVEQDGKIWRISDRCIEHEYEYQVSPNCWLPKDHPKTIAAERALVARPLRDA